VHIDSYILRSEPWSLWVLSRRNPRGTHFRRNWTFHVVERPRLRSCCSCSSSSWAQPGAGFRLALTLVAAAAAGGHSVRHRPSTLIGYGHRTATRWRKRHTHREGPGVESEHFTRLYVLIFSLYPSRCHRSDPISSPLASSNQKNDHPSWANQILPWPWPFSGRERQRAEL